MKIVNHKKLRTVEDNTGMIYIQSYKYFIWWTVFKTYLPAGARVYLDMSGLEYDENTGYYI